jgi:serine/threonine-protein kinase
MPESFEILGVLGRGAQGTVYRVRDRGSGAERALKVLEGRADPEAVVRFRREAEALARLGGKGVVPVHASWEENGRLSILMDFMPRGSLRDLMAARRLDWREAATLVASLARTVERAASLGLVHRDLKPENVLLDDEGEPRIADFGCARDLAAASLTETGALIGTPAYMAPEQLDGRRVDASADAFALGVILHEALTGALPFPGPTALAIFQSMRAGRRASAPFAKDCPASIVALLDRALALDPARRASAPEIAATLETALAGKATAPRAWRLPALALGIVAVTGALALALAGGGAAPAPPPPPPPPPPPRQVRPFETDRVVRGFETASPWKVFDEEVARVGTDSVPGEALGKVLEAARRRASEDAREFTAGAALETFPRAEAIMETAVRQSALGAPVEVPTLGDLVVPYVHSWDQPGIDTARLLRVMVRLVRFRREIGVEHDDVFIDWTSQTLLKHAVSIGLPLARSLADEFLASAKESPWTHYTRARVLLLSLLQPGDRDEGEKELRAAIDLSDASPPCAQRIAGDLPRLRESGSLQLDHCHALATRIAERFPDVAFPHLALGRLYWAGERDVSRARAEFDLAREIARADDMELAATLWGAVVRAEGGEGPAAGLAFLDEHRHRVSGAAVRLRVRLLIESGRRSDASAALEKAVADGVKDEYTEPTRLSLPQLAALARAAGDDPAAWKKVERETRVIIP